MKSTKKGECDACPKVDVDLYPSGNMLLCVTCYQAEVKAIGDSKWINNALATGKIVETPIQLKQDIFNAVTTPFIELKLMIAKDAEVPQDKKNEVFMQAIEAKIKNLRDAIFLEKQATLAKENEVYSWAQQRREFISKLQESEREKFKKFDVNYTPKSPTKREKTTKPTKPANKMKFSMAECKAAASKYGVQVSGVQAWYVQKKGELSYEECAKRLAEMMK